VRCQKYQTAPAQGHFIWICGTGKYHTINDPYFLIIKEGRVLYS